MHCNLVIFFVTCVLYNTTIYNQGTLPSSFEEGYQPRFWVLEFIIKVISAFVLYLVTFFVTCVLCDTNIGQGASFWR
jgi:hypothetical protein